MAHMAVGTSESAYYARLGVALREMRAAADLSRERVARDLRVSVETVARWERGDNAIKAFHLAALAEMCGLLPGAYIDLLDPPELINPWRDRLAHAEADAARWGESARTESRRTRPAERQ